jgi:hypothetical protein
LKALQRIRFEKTLAIDAVRTAEFGALVGPSAALKEFPTLVKMVRVFDVPDGIIAHVTRKCGGKVHDCHVGFLREGDLGA